MINEENTTLRVFIAIFNILSILGCIIILWTIKNTPRLSKNPGSIIQRIAIFQIVLICIKNEACSFQLFFSQFYFQEKSINQYTHGVAFIISDAFCDVIGFLQIWIGTQYIFYNIFFVSNLYFSLKIQNYNFTNYFKTMEYMGVLISFLISLTALLTQNIGIGVIGQCGVENTKLEIIMAGSMCFILISTIILIILISTIKGSVQNQLYELDSEKFQKKQKEFIRVNILYSVVFLITHLTPDLYLLIYWMANDFSIQSQTYVAKEILLLNISIAGILLFAIRMSDPFVYKFFVKSIQSNRPQSLKRKLINKSESQVTIEVENKSIIRDRLAYSQEQDPTAYRMTNPVLSNDQFAINQSLQPLKLMKQKSVISQIQSKFELVQIIIAIKFQLLKQIPLLNLKPFLPYNFINMVKTDVFLKHNKFQLEEIIQQKEHYNQKIDYYIDSENEQNKIIIFSYASKILIDWLSQYFGLDIKCLQESLSIEQNIEKIVNCYFDLCQRGTIYITHDCLLSLDIITREQKILLTKGGALLNICRRWYEESTNTQDEGGSLLPSILGVYSINMDDGRCINVVLRLNIPKIDYPLYEDSWLMMKENNYDPFVRNNIIGWIQVTSNQIVDLFKPKYIYDGKFQIQLTVIIIINQKNDFKLNPQGQKNLISTLKKDLNYQFITNKVTLTFVYFKFTSKRLQSIVKHEEKNERVELMDSLDNSIKLQCKQMQKNIGTFELDSKIGYVKVFFDQLWNEPYVQLQQEVRDTLYEGLIEKVTEII